MCGGGKEEGIGARQTGKWNGIGQSRGGRLDTDGI